MKEGISYVNVYILVRHNTELLRCAPSEVPFPICCDIPLSKRPIINRQRLNIVYIVLEEQIICMRYGVPRGGFPFPVTRLGQGNVDVASLYSIISLTIGLPWNKHKSAVHQKIDFFLNK